MAKPARKFNSNDSGPRSSPLWEFHGVAGDITATSVRTIIAPFAGIFDDISQLFLYAGNTGADGTDPLQLALDVSINGTSIFTTLPALTKAATDGDDTRAAGTGITVGVLKALASRTFAKGDVIAISLTLTRTTPEDEMADVHAVVGLTELSDFDPDHTVNI